MFINPVLIRTDGSADVTSVSNNNARDSARNSAGNLAKVGTNV